MTKWAVGNLAARRFRWYVTKQNFKIVLEKEIASMSLPANVMVYTKRSVIKIQYIEYVQKYNRGVKQEEDKRIVLKTQFCQISHV